MFLLTGIALLSAGVVQQEFSFTEPEFSTRDGFDKVAMENLTVITKPGYPELPVQSVQMLLPPGEEAVSVQVDYDQTETLAGTYNVYPIQKPYPISYEGEISFVSPAEEIYSRNVFYPEVIYSDLTTQYLRGHSIALLNISPLQYNPQTGEIIFYGNLRVTIQTQTTAASQRAYNNFYRDDEQTNQRLAKLVNNPQSISQYPASENTREVDDFEYIIVTPSSYLTELAPFIEFKVSQGYHVFTKTTQDIYVEYTGTDIADQIRNFIIDAYQNMGAENVLLVGDIGQVPHRGFWVNAGGTEDFNIPSELYYEGLDRVGNGTGPDWNTNGDGKWAETSEADYFSEVNVGRISAGNTTELAAAVNKQIMYQNEPVVSQLGNALMVGEELNNSPYTYGGTYKDEIMNGGTYNGYTTAGIDPDMTVNTLYERDGYWSVAQLQNHMNNGLNFLNHLGHSNTDYNMKFYNNTVNNQTLTANGIDNNFFLIYSQGCLPAAIETDCIAEKFTTIENGCVAFIGNTRYGWYMPGGTNSSSQYMDRQFFDALFDENITQISAMNTDSKEDGAAMVNGDAWFRWSYYCLIVLGDPTLDVWTEIPAEIEVTYQPSIPLGASEIPFQTDAPYARIALLQNGELIGRAVADEFGDVLLETFEPIITPEEITVSIIGHNKTRHLGNMVVISNEPYIIVESYEVNDPAGNGNNLPDFGESITLNMTLQNVGNQPAENIIATISTNDLYVTITDDNANFGTIAIQGSSTLAEAFALDIANNVPDQHEVGFELNATDGTTTWTCNFSLTLNAPVLGIGEMLIDDSSGNDNGVLDPGESVTITIPVSNDGQAESLDAMATLFCATNGITIGTGTVNLGPLGIELSVDAVYIVSADISIPFGTPIILNFIVVAGEYEIAEDFPTQVGIHQEDFENGFTQYPWEFQGYTISWPNVNPIEDFDIVSPIDNIDWSIDTNEFYSGAASAKSYPITHNQASFMSITLDVTMDGEISFWYKVACEYSPSQEYFYDGLVFFIDGETIDRFQPDADGQSPWTFASYPVLIGTHTFDWAYVKDSSDGTTMIPDDCAWVDFVTFPAMVPVATGTIEGSVSLIPLGLMEDVEITIGSTTISPDETGLFSLTVPVGTYTATASLEGYETITIEDIQVLEGQVTPISFELYYLQAPENLVAESNDAIVNLTWEHNQPSENSGRKQEYSSREFQNFNIYRSVDASFFELLASTDDLFYEDILETVGEYNYYITAVYDQDNESEASNTETIIWNGTGSDDPLIPLVNALYQNYPNPFNPTTSISYGLNIDSRVVLNIFNLRGQKVITLINEIQNAGYHQIHWSGLDENNRQVTSGVYFYEMDVKETDYTSVKKMILLK